MSDSPVKGFEIETFYDGDCPVCVREVAFLRRLDRKKRILFTDIASEQFDPRVVGISWDDLMDRIHARLADGTVVEGVEVFRRLYAAVGFGPVVSLTRIPGISNLLDLAYRSFAKNRIRLTGRCTDESCVAHGSPASHV